MNWEEIREDKQELLNKLNQYGAKGLVNNFDATPDTIAGITNHWVKKHNLIYNRSQGIWREANKEAEVEGQEERKPDIVDKGSYYTVTSGKRTVEIDKDDLRQIKKLYCGENNLSINQVCIEMGLARPEFMIIKNAFSITHDDIPHLDEDIQNNDIDKLVEQDLQERKKQYFIKLQQKEIDKLKKEVKQYRKKEYYIDKVINTLKNDIGKLDYRPPAFEREKQDKDRKLLITLSDWHTGKLVESAKVVGGAAGYNQKIFEERKDKFANEVIELIKIYKPSEIKIVNTGDGLDDPEGKIYEGQPDHQELKYEEQIIAYQKALIDFILAIYDYQPEIEFVAIPGNHSSGKVNYDIMVARQVKMMLDRYDSITFDTEKKKYKTRQINNCNYVFTHGENLRTGTNTRENDLLNIINRLGYQKNKTYVLQGHLHHLEKQGQGYRHILLPSIVGADDLSANIMNTGSRPGQMCFLLNDKGIEIEKYTYFD